MTALDDRPRNGHTTPPPQNAQALDPPQPDSLPAPATTDESERVRQLRQRLDNRTAERDLSHQLHDVDSDTVFDEVRSVEEQRLDREVAENIRKKQRRDRERAGKAEVRRQRWQRTRARWDERAERSRDRILDPARTLGADHRRWVASSVALFAMLAGGVAFMSRTVHDGLVGENGTWLAYLVEPLASVLLIVSLLAQFTARQRGIEVPRSFIAFDAGLALSSLLLMTVPYGIRYGWEPGSLIAHMLLPLLVIASVVGWHIASRIYGEAIANSKKDPTMRDRLALLRAATAAGEIPVDASANRITKYLRANLPGGIGHEAARTVARNFLGY